MANNKVRKRDLKRGLMVYQGLDNLYYKSGVGMAYQLVKPYIEVRTFTSFIPECRGDNDTWDEHLEIIGADCDVWVTEKWWVKRADLKMNSKLYLKDIHAYLCKWSTAIKSYPNLISCADLETQGYFEEVKPDKKKK